MKFKTTYQDIEFIVSIEEDPNYQEIHRYSGLDLEEDDDIDEYDPYLVFIQTSFQGYSQTFYLYGVYLENDTEDIADELADILDEQNIFDQAARELLKLIEQDENPSKFPSWGKE